MVEESEQTQNQWMSIDQSSRVEIDKTVSLMTEPMVTEGIEATQPQPRHSTTTSNDQLGVTERAFSAAGAAFLSAIIVNPLDVAKVFYLNLWGAQYCVFVLLIYAVCILLIFQLCSLIPSSYCVYMCL